MIQSWNWQNYSFELDLGMCRIRISNLESTESADNIRIRDSILKIRESNLESVVIVTPAVYPRLAPSKWKLQYQQYITVLQI